MLFVYCVLRPLLSACLSTGGVASAVKKPAHFEVRKSSSQVNRMHFFALFSSKKVDDLFQLSLSKHRPPTLFHCQNKTNKAVRYDNIFIFCSHYYRSKAIHRARQGGARAVDLPARSFDAATAVHAKTDKRRIKHRCISVGMCTTVNHRNDYILLTCDHDL